MDMQETMSHLPHGLHDASVTALDVDLVHGSVNVHLELWVGQEAAATEEERERTRCALLRLCGVRAVVMDPPRPSMRFARAEGVDVDGGFGDFPGEPPRLPDAPVKLWLWVETWEARIEIAAESCELSWRPEGPEGPARR